MKFWDVTHIDQKKFFFCTIIHAVLMLIWEACNILLFLEDYSKAIIIITKNWYECDTVINGY